MDATDISSPFGNEPLREVPLPRAPLERVIAQVRFPKEPVLGTEDGAGAVRARLKARYPILREEPQIEVTVTAAGATQRASGVLWRLHDTSAAWQVSVTSTFVALDTSAYESRTDFCKRLGEVLAAISEVAAPVVYDRVGVRYIDRVTDEALLGRLPELVQPEILGAMAVLTPVGVDLLHALTEAVFQFEAGQLVSRWGMLPANATVEPTLDPVAVRSWILDIDAATSEVGEFDVKALTALAQAHAERVYRFFRWAVTDDFLRAHGGDI